MADRVESRFFSNPVSSNAFTGRVLEVRNQLVKFGEDTRGYQVQTSSPAFHVNGVRFPRCTPDDVFFHPSGLIIGVLVGDVQEHEGSTYLIACYPVVRDERVVGRIPLSMHLNMGCSLLKRCTEYAEFPLSMVRETLMTHGAMAKELRTVPLNERVMGVLKAGLIPVPVPA